MKSEIQSAVNFLANLLRGLSVEEVAAFSSSLNQVLSSHYRDHWFPEKPCRGSAYRCIRINQNRLDPLLASAGVNAGLTEALLLRHSPSELTIWIDPNEVSYRFGEDGSIGVIYEEQRGPMPPSIPVEPTPPRKQDATYFDMCRKVQSLFQTTMSMNSGERRVVDCLRSVVVI